MSKRREREKIVQIMPAPGWFAQYQDDNENLFERPLVCWVLERFGSGDDRHERITGRVIAPSVNGSNFVGYGPADEIDGEGKFEGYYYRPDGGLI